MHTAVGASVPITYEAPLAHWPIPLHERRDVVARAHLIGKSHLGVYCRTGPADRGLRMAAAAAIQVHRRAKAFVRSFRLVEFVFTCEEECLFSLGKSRDRRRSEER